MAAGTTAKRPRAPCRAFTPFRALSQSDVILAYVILVNSWVIMPEQQIITDHLKVASDEVTTASIAPSLFMCSIALIAHSRRGSGKAHCTYGAASETPATELTVGMPNSA